MIPDYTRNFFESVIEYSDFIANHILPTKMISFNFEVLGKFTFSETNDDFHNGMELAAIYCNECIKLYEEKFKFTRPILMYNPGEGDLFKFTVKLGLIDKDKYEEWKKLNEK